MSHSQRTYIIVTHHTLNAVVICHTLNTFNTVVICHTLNTLNTVVICHTLNTLNTVMPLGYDVALFNLTNATVAAEVRLLGDLLAVRST